MSAPRVGVAFPGDAEDVTAFSGTPYGVLHGLRTLGVAASGIRAAPPERLDRAVALADALRRTAERRTLPRRAVLRADFAAGLQGEVVSRVRTRFAARAADDVDAVVQIGTGYRLAPGVRHVIYDDMTVAQAQRHPYPAWTAMRPRDRRFRLEQQREAYLGADLCAMTNSWAAHSVVTDYGVPAERVCVVGVGTHEARRSPVRDVTHPRLLFVGLDWERKNGPRVLRAFARLREEVPGAELDVVGGHPPIDQPGVRTHGVVRRTTAEGAATLSALFDRATCFVMPSLYEPSAVVFTEAAATGLPSIGGSVGGSADLIGDGGLVVDPTDDDALLDALRTLSDPAEAAAASARAAARAELFTWPAVAGRLLRALGVTVPGTELPALLPVHGVAP